MECKVSRDDYGGGDGLRVLANSVMTLQSAREQYARSLTLYFQPEHNIRETFALLNQHRAENSSAHSIPVHFFYRNSEAQGELDTGGRWRLQPDAGLFDQLTQTMGEYNISVGW
jgi:DNA polymerase-3 subunit alpha